MLLTLFVYLPVAELGWIWDDDQYVTANVVLTNPSGLWDIWFVPGATPQYYPLVFTTFWLIEQLWGEGPLAFHLLNVALHAVNVVLCFRVLEQLKFPYAFWVALAFGIHPIHVESVAWVTELKNVLSATFYGLAWLVLFPVFDNSRNSNNGARFALGGLLFACALLSKSVTATLPAALLVAAWYRYGKLTKKQILWMAPLVVMGGAFGWNTARLEVEHVGAYGSDWDYGVLERVGIASRCIVHYAANIWFPLEQAFFYRRYDPFAFAPAIVALAMLIAAVSIFALRAYQGHRGLLAGFLFFAGSAFPALGFLNVYPHRFSYVADHFVYLPSVGLLAIVVAAGMHAGTLLSQRFSAGTRPLIAVLPLVLWCVWLSLGTLRHLPVFANEITLWEDTLDKNPECLIAMHNLSMRYEEAGRNEEALALLQRALEHDFERHQMLNTLGVVQFALGNYDEAETAFRESIALEPLNPLSVHNLAKVMCRDAEPQDYSAEAREMLQRAKELYQLSFKDRPLYMHAYGVGITSFELADYGDAQQWFEKALDCKHDDLGALYSLALTHYELKDFAVVRSLCMKILELSPSDGATVELLSKLDAAEATP